MLAVLYAGTANADPYLEGSAFFGVDDFGPRIALGGALAPEQRPQTSPLFGVRMTAMLVRTVVFDLGVEPELVLTPAWTGYGFDGPRDSYFAPVFGYRGSLILRTRAPHVLRFHALAGLGGATVVSKSPYMSTDTDPVLYYGVGATLAVGDGWEMRLDARQGFMPARAGGSTAIYEGMVGIGLRFGAVPAAAPHPVVEHPPIVEVTPPPPVTPLPPPPPPDRDGDGVPDSADKCPDQPEDKDGFEDADGCPDLDNDTDGIPDAKDKCPNEPETRNGYQDDDGCPDQLPVALVAAFETATAVRFEPGHARLTDAAKTSLVKAVTQLHANPTLHVFVIGHPDAKGDAAKTGPLAQKRAETVKWYLVDQGVPADQIETATGSPAEKGRVIELRIGPASPH
jgi:outer membrane protein OmpA-like peptidoglycan-associated protein